MSKTRERFIHFFRLGLAVVVPVIILIFIGRWLFNLFDGMIGWVTMPIEHWTRIPHVVVSLLVMAACVFLIAFIGRFVSTTRVGEQMHQGFERLVTIVVPVYRLIKKAVDNFTKSGSNSFYKVARHRYVMADGDFFLQPGLVIYGEKAARAIKENCGDAIITLYLPNGPNPTGGRLIQAPLRTLIVSTAPPADFLQAMMSLGLEFEQLFESLPPALLRQRILHQDLKGPIAPLAAE